MAVKRLSSEPPNTASETGCLFQPFPRGHERAFGRPDFQPIGETLLSSNQPCSLEAKTNQSRKNTRIGLLPGKNYCRTRSGLHKCPLNTKKGAKTAPAEKNWRPQSEGPCACMHARASHASSSERRILPVEVENRATQIPRPRSGHRVRLVAPVSEPSQTVTRKNASAAEGSLSELTKRGFATRYFFYEHARNVL